jgi:hypothetical protein
MLGLWPYNFHYSPGDNHLQCFAWGKHGKYILRRYIHWGIEEWDAIQLFGYVGCISAVGQNPIHAYHRTEERQDA